MSDEKKIHPLRRKHRRGKRGGKKHRPVLVVAPPAPPVAPNLSQLRCRLTLLSRTGTHG